MHIHTMPIQVPRGNNASEVQTSTANTDFNSVELKAEEWRQQQVSSAHMYIYIYVMYIHSYICTYVCI